MTKSEGNSSICSISGELLINHLPTLSIGITNNLFCTFFGSQIFSSRKSIKHGISGTNLWRRCHAFHIIPWDIQGGFSEESLDSQTFSPSKMAATNAKQKTIPTEFGRACTGGILFSFSLTASLGRVGWRERDTYLEAFSSLQSLEICSIQHLPSSNRNIIWKLTTCWNSLHIYSN